MHHVLSSRGEGAIESFVSELLKLDRIFFVGLGLGSYLQCSNASICVVTSVISTMTPELTSSRTISVLR
jgi:hypothetical protein